MASMYHQDAVQHIAPGPRLTFRSRQHAHSPTGNASTSEIRVSWVNSRHTSILAHAALVVVSAPSSRQVWAKAFSIIFGAKKSRVSAAFIKKDMAVQGNEERSGSRRSTVSDGQVA